MFLLFCFNFFFLLLLKVLQRYEPVILSIQKVKIELFYLFILKVYMQVEVIACIYICAVCVTDASRDRRGHKIP